MTRQAAFQKWLGQFKQLDRQISEQMQRDQGKNPPSN